MIITLPQQIRTDPRGRNGELICRNCGRLGDTHVCNPPLPFSCRSYEGEIILETVFEAVCTFRPIEIPG